MDILLILSGLVTLFLGGESLIKGSIYIAKNLKISNLLVSAVVIGFGTSMPEMTVSVNAMIKGSPDIAIGNVVGSNIANILFIIGICAVIRPITIEAKSIRKDVWVMMAATIILFILGFALKIDFLSGLFMLAILITYITYSYLSDKKSLTKKDIKNIEQDLSVTKTPNIYFSIVIAFLGILLLVLGSSLFLNGAISLAQKFNISESVIGLGMVAVGSCLPELSTALIAAIRKHSNIVISSIIGSNIFNILSISAVISLIDDVYLPKQMANFDLSLLLLLTLIFSFILLKNITFNRIIGSVFLASYVVYFYALFTN